MGRLLLFWIGHLLLICEIGVVPLGRDRGIWPGGEFVRSDREIFRQVWLMKLTVLSLSSFSLASSSRPCLFSGFFAAGSGLATPIISSSSLFRFCSGVSCQDELSPPFSAGAFAPLLVLKPRARGLLGSMREARPSCSGGMVIQSSRRGLDVVDSSNWCAGVRSEVGSDAVAAAAPPAGGNEGPKSSSSLLLSSSSCLVSSAGSVGLSSKGAGGMAGPATFLRFSEASSGLGERCFAPEAVPGAFSLSSSCCRFRLARRWGGRAAPMPDIVLSCWWYCVAFWVCFGDAIAWMELWVLERACLLAAPEGSPAWRGKLSPQAAALERHDVVVVDCTCTDDHDSVLI